MAVIEQAKEVATKLAKDVSPVAIILFGSTARAGEGNDLDLLVVTDHEGMYERVGESLREFFRRFSIDYFVATCETITEEFRKGSPFLSAIQKEGRLLYMRDSSREWVHLASEDLRQAQYLLEGAFFRGACFAAQQALEKGLKAELLQKGWELERIHSIRRLLSISEDYGIEIECEDRDVDFMDSIYRGRYPAEEGLLPLKHPTADDARRAVSIARSALMQMSIFQEGELRKVGRD
jgi:HEPN domain-containing protein/predicted nucleotidyltransferase